MCIRNWQLWSLKNNNTPVVKYRIQNFQAEYTYYLLKMAPSCHMGEFVMHSKDFDLGG